MDWSRLWTWVAGIAAACAIGVYVATSTASFFFGMGALFGIPVLTLYAHATADILIALFFLVAARLRGATGTDRRSV